MATGKRKRKAQQPVEIDPEDLKRFAGSSDEGDSDQEESEVEQNGPQEAVDSEDDQPQQMAAPDDSDSEKEEEAMNRQAGMTNAMARILGSRTDEKKQTVVLSKTTTPMQRAAAEEKQKLKELKEKRKLNRERKSSALYKPLSGAMSDVGGDVAQEIEQERMHKRVATRGVVALFNAISQHQKTVAAATPTEKKKDTKKMTKYDFLDMVKSKAAAKAAENLNDEAEDSKPKSTDGKWNALQDDFMLNPKKNWDQESSSEEDVAEHLDDES